MRRARGFCQSAFLSRLSAAESQTCFFPSSARQKAGDGVRMSSNATTAMQARSAGCWRRYRTIPGEGSCTGLPLWVAGGGETNFKPPLNKRAIFGRGRAALAPTPADSTLRILTESIPFLPWGADPKSKKILRK